MMKKIQNNVMKAKVMNVSRHMYQKEHHFPEQHCSCLGLQMMSALDFKIRIDTLVAGFSACTNLTYPCKTETFGSLYSHAIVIPLKSKHQVVHEQKFKDLSSTCQASVERIVLDLESEVVRGLGSIPTGGNIL